jgi:hypothetical protein
MPRHAWMLVAALLSMIFAIIAPSVSGFLFGFVHGPTLILPLSLQESMLFLSFWALMFITVLFTAWCAEHSDRSLAILLGLVLGVAGMITMFWVGSAADFSELLTAEMFWRVGAMTSPAVLVGAALRERVGFLEVRQTAPARSASS